VSETLREYAKNQKENAIRESGKWEGKASAFEDMAEHLDPTKFCQDCGYGEYKTAGGRSYGTTREEHEAKCEVRQERIIAEGDKWAKEFGIVLGKLQPGHDADSFPKKS
jgi:hypothetical protein